ncbi:hypothetical protein BDW22DRAFT_1353469 [Trametopsis cervina]|nr:hypothetical protein BDW22DRAFT_1353469 [Trametopsis cervina]
MTSQQLWSQVAEKWQTAFTRLNRSEPGIVGLLSFSESWILAKDFLRPRSIDEPSPKATANMQRVRAAFDKIAQRKMLTALLEQFLEDMRLQLPHITKDIEELMTAYEVNPDPAYIAACISRLLLWHVAWAPVPELGPTVLTAFTTTFQTHVFSVLPSSFSQGFKSLVSATLDPRYATTPPAWMNSLFPTPGPSLHRWDKPLWLAFEQLGMTERYESLIASVCYEHIEKYILETYAKVWDRECLEEIRIWMTNHVVPWLIMPYAPNAKTIEEARPLVSAMGTRLDYHVCKTLADLRTSEIFDIIIDFPESKPALDDLRVCLLRVDQRSQLVQSLRKANARRLLHPGADTKLILQQYVSIIKCLRIIDPQGVLLFKVADPIRRYLRERPDTIRCVVASLVADNESGDSLVDSNEAIQPLQQAQVDDYADPNWEPEPHDAGPDFRTNKPSDIISTLVSIYDSRDLFIKELQILMAQRLLAIKDGNFDKERRNLEVLKIRFGEAQLQVCEVMLRDMTDSRRTDQHVQSQNKPETATLHPTIISRHFWPSLQASTFTMPGQFKEIQEAYQKEFTTFKPDKKLVWMSHLGTVSLDIELDDRTVSVEVPPLEAAIVELFSEQDEWTVEKLVSTIGSVDRNAVIKALTTWLNHGVVKEIGPDAFKLLNIAEDMGPRNKVQKQPAAVIEEEVPLVTSQQQQVEQMKVFWKFIEGMLKNLGSQPLDRIHMMLKIAPDYDRTIDQLGSFMEAARREGLVTVKDGVWKLQL